MILNEVESQVKLTEANKFETIFGKTNDLS